ncbi:AraC family transcriptional regulator [Halobacillus salinarum]|uniref:AraC family transcriptional regulator n=1 Tax=Halobacillus salinarum TaxID=2932257 RepID=A0ABY4EMK2_9BACI|nr:AraC family transcriptional regulator [Halobacillus salinarum]UOQ45681.1 AraC family transcriptional regulator [Halobacillus salinarum]
MLTHEWYYLLSDCAAGFNTSVAVYTDQFKIVRQYPAHLQSPPKIIRDSLIACMEEVKDQPDQLHLFSNIHYQHFFVYPLFSRKNNGLFIAFGPVLLGTVGRKQLEKVFIQNQWDEQYEEAVMRYYQQLPIVLTTQVKAMEKLLNVVLTSIRDNTLEENAGRDRFQSLENRQDFHQLFLEGNGKALEAFQMDERFCSIISNDPVRTEKNKVIVFIAELSQLTVEAGVPEEQVISLGDFYTNYLESEEQLSVIKQLKTAVMKSFLECVRDYRESRLKSPIVDRAQRYITQNLTEPISLSSIAEELQVHPNYLSTVFAKEMGNSISQFINYERIKKAKELLSITSYTLMEISILLGYNSQSYFTRVFKKIVGIGPREFRNYFYTSSESSS